MSETQDVLQNAFLQNNVADVNIAVKAEDVQQNSGIDFSKHFFEPKVGNSYLIKFLPNPGGAPIEHRSVYKNLPDPERKGKTFHYVSSGNAKTCKALNLFFELFALKKEGDAVAEKKIDKYLSRTNQGCVKIQVLSSPVVEEIGIIRMFTFATFGPNATIANLLDQKINPTKEQIALGYSKEDVFNIFGSDVVSLVCEEATYDGIKGRDYTKSGWVPKKTRGAIAIMTDPTDPTKVLTHEFVPEDVVDGNIIPTIEPFFNAFVTNVTHEDYDIRNYFSYKIVDDPRNSKETNDYLKSVFAKVDEIIPIIKEKTLIEIAAYGKAVAPSAGDKGAKTDNAKNVLTDSLPAELAGSVMASSVPEEKAQPAENAEVADILAAE